MLQRLIHTALLLLCGLSLMAASDISQPDLFAKSARGICDGDTLRLDTTICATALPFHWYGVTFHGDSSVIIATPAFNYLRLIVRVTPNPIQHLHPLDVICSGDTMPVTIGRQSNSTVTLNFPNASMSRSERIFLPDGMSCPPYGTYYRSFFPFSDFPANSTIQSPDDILFLRIKMEHSALEDLQVKLVCPNGQSCQITPTLSGGFFNDYWDGVFQNPYFRLNLGLANRQTDHLSCDSTLSPIGIPWNYVWSDNTNRGYQYAGGSHSFMYEPANVHTRYNPLWDNSAGQGFYPSVVDSSNVALMQNIYHPKQSFSNLIGCPLNGNWYIQVQDLRDDDNGYLVEWELVLDPSLLASTTYSTDSITMIGNYVTRTSDSTFIITPDNIPDNHVVNSPYTIHTYTAGCVFDTSFTVQIEGAKHAVIHDTIRHSQLPYTYNGRTLTSVAPSDTTLVFHSPSVHSCDSTLEYVLHIVTADTNWLVQNICDHELPYTWNGVVFNQAGVQIVTLHDASGADSLVLFLTLNVQQSQHFDVYGEICQGEPYTEEGFNLPSDSTRTPGQHTFTRTEPSQTGGCDNLITLHLNISPLPVMQASSDMVIDSGQTVQLWASGCEFYVWSPASAVSNLTTATTTGSPTSSMYFFVSGYNSNINLVANGDFEQGNTGFTSAYTLGTNSGYSQWGTLGNEGTYMVGNNANTYHTNFQGAHDHTSGSGKYMIVNGSTNPGTVVWSQTINVTPNTDYAFSTWVTTVANDPWAQLQFRINNQQIGPIFSAPSTYGQNNTWLNFYQIWNSGNNTQAAISIINQNTGGGGNDFGMDDISFVRLTNCGITDTIQVLIRRDIDTMICDHELPFDWHGHIFTGPDTVEHLIVNPNGVDDAVIMHLTVGHSFFDTVDVVVNENDLPYIYNGIEFYDDTTIVDAYTSATGCDSVYYFSLQVHRNSTSTLDTTVCDYQTPFVWNNNGYISSGTYTTTLTNQHGADSILTLNLTVIPTHIQILSFTENFCEEGYAELQVVTDFEDYVWSTAETAPTITVYASGNYSVEGINGSCTNRASISLPACEYMVLLPNCITPSNKDGLNEQFGFAEALWPQILNRGFDVSIYDRWGELVYYSTDKTFRWNGTVNGHLYKNTIYNYIIHYQNKIGEKQVIKGSVMVF